MLAYFFSYIGEGRACGVIGVHMGGCGFVYMCSYEHYSQRRGGEYAEQSKGEEDIYKMFLVPAGIHGATSLLFNGMTSTSGIRLEPTTSYVTRYLSWS